MKIAKLISLLLVLSLIFSGQILAQEQEKEEARKMYEEAKKLVYEKEWSLAVEAFKKIAEEFKKSAYMDEPVYWLGEVENEESLKFLARTFDSGGHEAQKALVFIISSHDHPKAYDFLRSVALGDYATKLRKNAVFWLGQKDSREALKFFEEILLKKK